MNLFACQANVNPKFPWLPVRVVKSNFIGENIFKYFIDQILPGQFVTCVGDELGAEISRLGTKQLRGLSKKERQAFGWKQTWCQIMTFASLCLFGGEFWKISVCLDFSVMQGCVSECLFVWVVAHMCTWFSYSSTFVSVLTTSGQFVTACRWWGGVLNGVQKQSGLRVNKLSCANYVPRVVQ